MNRYLILILWICFAHSMVGQTQTKADSVLQGSTGALEIIYPLSKNIRTKDPTIGIVYPLLVVNNVIIRDPKAVDCFRNRYERKEIKRIRRMTKDKAEKRGIPNVPKDGVVLVTTRKNYYIDLSCE